MVRPPFRVSRVSMTAAALTDRYDRYLLYVWNEQGTFVNESLVRSGHVKAVLYPPNDKYWPRISDAEDAAQQAGSGLWAACPEQPETSIAPRTRLPRIPRHVQTSRTGLPLVSPTWTARTCQAPSGSAPMTRTALTGTETASAAMPTDPPDS